MLASPLLPLFFLWLSLFVPIALVAWRLVRYLDEATLTVEAKRRDHERNFALKNKAEAAMEEWMSLCRLARSQIESSKGIQVSVSARITTPADASHIK